MTSIDLSPQLADIRRKYPDYWRSEGAQREAQALWGNAPCNEGGILEANEEITIELEPHWEASVNIAHAPNGWFAFAVRYSYGIGGGCAAISVWNDTAYTTRDEALEAGIRKLKVTYQRLLNCQHGEPEMQQINAARMIARLDQYLSQSRQLSLF